MKFEFLKEFSFIGDSQTSINTALHNLNFQGVFDKSVPATQSQSNTSTEFQDNETEFRDDDTETEDSLPLSKTRKVNARRHTFSEDHETNSSKKIRKDDSTSSGAEYRNLFTENLLKQSENHILHSEVLQLQKDKFQVELDRAKLELETARSLSKIEINKQKQLADLEIRKKQMELKK